MAKHHATKDQLREIAGPPVTTAEPDGYAISDAPPVIPTEAHQLTGPSDRWSGLALPKADDPPCKWPMSFERLDNEALVAIANAQLRADTEITLEKPATIRLHDWVVMPSDQLDEETGELHQFLTLILWDEQGRTVKTTSSVVMRRLGTWLQLWPDRQWRHLEITISTYASRKNPQQTYHDAKVRYVP